MGDGFWVTQWREDSNSFLQKKEDHTEKVEFCWYYSAGTCPYGEQKCWFIHDKEDAKLKCFFYETFYWFSSFTVHLFVSIT